MGEEGGSERRRHKRFGVDGMNVGCTMQLATEVKLLNLSLGGAAIELKRQLRMGNRYSMKISSGGKTFLMRGVVVWEHLAGASTGNGGESAPVYTAGIKFDNVFTGKGEELAGFIDEAIEGSADKVTRARGVRVKLEGEHTVLDYPSHYMVKKMSLGGMLIETEVPLEKDSRFRLQIELPQDHGAVHVLGRIASCHEVAESRPKRYDVGVEFFETSKKDRARLSDFIRSLDGQDSKDG